MKFVFFFFLFVYSIFGFIVYAYTFAGIRNLVLISNHKRNESKMEFVCLVGDMSDDNGNDVYVFFVVVVV